MTLSYRPAETNPILLTLPSITSKIELIEGKTLICNIPFKKDKETGEQKYAKLYYGNILKDMPYPIAHRNELGIDEEQYNEILQEFIETKKIVTY